MKNDKGDLDSDYTDKQHAEANKKSENELAKKVNKMADNSKGTVYQLLSDGSTVDIRSWITQDNATSSICDRKRLRQLDLEIRHGLESSKDGTYRVSNPLPRLVQSMPTQVVVDGRTYHLNQQQHEALRGVLDSAIAIASNTH